MERGEENLGKTKREWKKEGGKKQEGGEKGK